MADAASGSADKSVQVKLVLLGKSFSQLIYLTLTLLSRRSCRGQIFRRSPLRM